tara:strand:+ start:8880 stop:9005 length:126 start_codon:yes stop_codon:yes gene_type:complete
MKKKRVVNTESFEDMMFGGMENLNKIMKKNNEKEMEINNND